MALGPPASSGGQQTLLQDHAGPGPARQAEMSKATIIFVEDDAAGRKVGTYNLEPAGYRVEVVGAAEELERIVQRYPEK